MIKKFFHAVMACGLIALVMSCEDQKFNNINVDVDKVELDHLTPDMIKAVSYTHLDVYKRQVQRAATG